MPHAAPDPPQYPRGEQKRAEVTEESLLNTSPQTLNGASVVKSQRWPSFDSTRA